MKNNKSLLLLVMLNIFLTIISFISLFMLIINSKISREDTHVKIEGRLIGMEGMIEYTRDLSKILLFGSYEEFSKMTDKERRQFMNQSIDSDFKNLRAE